MKAHRKNTAILIVVCIILSVVIAALIFIFQQDNLNETTDTVTPQNSFSPTPSNTQTETSQVPDTPLDGLNEDILEPNNPYTVKLDSSQIKFLDPTIDDDALALVYFPNKSVASFEAGNFLLNTKVFYDKHNYIGTITIISERYVKVGFLMADKDESLYILDVQKNDDIADLSLRIINRDNPITEQQVDGLTNLIKLTNPSYVKDNRQDLFILPFVKQALETLLNAADSQDASLNMHVASAYRSYTDQLQSFDYWVNKRVTEQNMTYKEAYEYTAGRVAIPGCSEHHNGLTLDVIGAGYLLDESSKGSPYAKWLKHNSYKYGFHIRYEEGKQDYTKITLYEPWHLRYVGLPTAYYLYQNNLCMEEFYYLLVKNGYVDFEFEDATYRYMYSASNNIYIDSQIMQIEQFSVIASGINGFVLLCRIN